MSETSKNCHYFLYKPCKESSKYYARIQTAVARGLNLPTCGLTGRQTPAAFQTLTLLFQFIFRVDGHAHRRTFAKREH